MWNNGSEIINSYKNIKIKVKSKEVSSELVRKTIISIALPLCDALAIQ